MDDDFFFSQPSLFYSNALNNKHIVETSDRNDEERVKIPINFKGSSNLPKDRSKSLSPVQMKSAVSIFNQNDLINHDEQFGSSKIKVDNNIKEKQFIQSIEDEKNKVLSERDRMQERLTMYELKEREIAGDGNCQFAAVSDQLFNTPKYHGWVRNKVTKWLESKANFLIDNSARLSDFLCRDIFQTWSDYVEYMKLDGSWGDHITLVAIANVFERTIMIISSIDNPGRNDGVIYIEPKIQKKGSPMLLLSHWHERHYGSLAQDN